MHDAEGAKKVRIFARVILLHHDGYSIIFPSRNSGSIKRL